MASFDDINGWEGAYNALVELPENKERFRKAAIGPPPKIPPKNLIEFTALTLKHSQIDAAYESIRHFKRAFPDHDWGESTPPYFPSWANERIAKFTNWYCLQTGVGPNHSPFRDIVTGLRLRLRDGTVPSLRSREAFELIKRNGKHTVDFEADWPEED